MKQIDQDPRDYRTEPVKGEPVFAPGGLRKLLINAVVFAAFLLISIPVVLILRPVAEFLSKLL